MIMMVWILQEEDSDSNAVVAESALDRLACGLGGKTVFPQIMNLTPGMLQVRSVSQLSPDGRIPLFLIDFPFDSG